MSIAELSSSTPPGYHSTATKNLDADFERRWTAWKARGLAHERVVRHRLMIVATVAGTITLAAVIAYGLLSS